METLQHVDYPPDHFLKHKRMKFSVRSSKDDAAEINVKASKKLTAFKRIRTLPFCKIL